MHRPLRLFSPITEDFQALTSGSLLGISHPHPEHRNTIIKAMVLTTVASLFILAGVWGWLANSQSKPEATAQPAVKEIPPPKVEAPQLIKVTLWDSEPKHAEVYYKDEVLGKIPPMWPSSNRQKSEPSMFVSVDIPQRRSP